MAALSGRPDAAPGRASLVVAALVLIVAGVLGVYFAQARSPHVQPLLLDRRAGGRRARRGA